MAEIKLTKNELRAQQRRLAQLEKYLPTLQLKKAMLQTEVQKARQDIQELQEELDRIRTRVEASSSLLSESTSVDPLQVAQVQAIDKHYENYAGVEVPIFNGVTFAPLSYSLVDTPPWMDAMVLGLRDIAQSKVKVSVAEEKKAALERELREVSIRVNLFEKILIPRANENIRHIRVFLGDQELAAVARAKVAKGKIEASRSDDLEGLCV
ncbi:MAG: V-type ATP synthase subunit D [Chlamydiales bacterium]|nr:V-type ATP synthase subunit D [Chlamydiales bacterium]